MTVATSPSRVRDEWLEQSDVAVSGGALWDRSAESLDRVAVIPIHPPKGTERAFAGPPLDRLELRSTAHSTDEPGELASGLLRSYLDALLRAQASVLIGSESFSFVRQSPQALGHPLPEACRRALDLLDRWYSEPAEKSEAYWDEFEREAIRERFSFRDLDT